MASASIFSPPIRAVNTDKPQSIPSLQTDAQPLPFLDYLIYQPEPAVILYNAGIYVQVPTPAHGVLKVSQNAIRTCYRPKRSLRSWLKSDRMNCSSPGRRHTSVVRPGADC
jgi:Nucleotidyltransferase